MNEEEAAFRRSLGHNDVYDASAESEDPKPTSADKTVFPTGLDSDAAVEAQPSIQQAPIRRDGLRGCLGGMWHRHRAAAHTSCADRNWV